MKSKADRVAKKEGEHPVLHARHNISHQPSVSSFEQILYLQKTVGNQAVQQLLRSGVILPKLKISQPNDKYEREADRVADIIMRMSEPLKGKLISPEEQNLQRKANEEEEEEDENVKELKTKIKKLVNEKFGGDYKKAFNHYDENNDKGIDAEELDKLLEAADVGNWATRGKWVSNIMERVDTNENGKIEWSEFNAVIEKSKKKEKTMQLKQIPEQIAPLFQSLPLEGEEKNLPLKEALGQTSKVIPHIESRISAVKGRGQPLPESTRSFFEARFGHDFSQVRLHTDAQAAESAQALNARAYTIGRHIVFGNGRYAPSTQTGQRLLAHELAHVTQASEGRIYRKATYLSQMENTYLEAGKGDERSYSERFENTSKCNVTTLAMQVETLAGTRRAREAIISLLIENGDARKREELRAYTTPDLILERFGQIQAKKQWKEKFKEHYPKRSYKKILETKKDRPWFLMGIALIVVGSEILNKTLFTPFYGSVSGKEKWATTESVIKHFKETLAPELATRAVMMMTRLTKGHIVFLAEMRENGIIINDPFGIRLNKKSPKKAKGYIINGSRNTRKRRRFIKNKMGLVEYRLAHNSEMLRVMKRFADFSEKTNAETKKSLGHRYGSNFPQKLGEKNFYSWDEVRLFEIGRWSSVLGGVDPAKFMGPPLTEVMTSVWGE